MTSNPTSCCLKEQRENGGIYAAIGFYNCRGIYAAIKSEIMIELCQEFANEDRSV